MDIKTVQGYPKGHYLWWTRGFLLPKCWVPAWGAPRPNDIPPGMIGTDTAFLFAGPNNSKAVCASQTPAHSYRGDTDTAAYTTAMARALVVFSNNHMY